MASRYWVTATIQTFNAQNVRVYRQETTATFDSLVDAAEQISALQAHPPVAVSGARCTQKIVLEGQEYNEAIPPAAACHEAAPPVLHRCPKCKSQDVCFINVGKSDEMRCYACLWLFSADESATR